MSQAPSTLGTITTSSLSPISATSRVRSSSTHGLSRALTRAQRAVSPKSASRAVRIRPSRAASFRSTGTASSRFPSRMSVCRAISGALAAIFWFEKSRKWIMREGLNGISPGGSGAPTASGFLKSRGLRTLLLGLRRGARDRRPGGAPGPAKSSTRAGPLGLRAAMTDTATQGIETGQAEREASGARPYGRYLEEFEVGAVYKHWPAKTVTEADDHLFCLITMNHHPLHINDVYAGKSQQGRNVVVGPLVYSLALGMSVSDVSGKAIANLATEELSHPAPVFHGDTLFVESEVLEVKESRSKPDRGIVKVKTDAYKQDGTLVATFKRAVLVPRLPDAAQGETAGAASGASSDP